MLGDFCGLLRLSELYYNFAICRIILFSLFEAEKLIHEQNAWHVFIDPTNVLHFKVCGPIVAVLFFSLDRPVTKNQILNTKCQPRFLALSQFQKRRTAWPLLFFRFEMTTKNFNWHLFLVTGWSSEKNICMYYCYAMLQHSMLLNTLCWQRQDNIISHGDKNETAHFILTIGLMFAKGIPLLPFH